MANLGISTSCTIEVPRHCRYAKLTFRTAGEALRAARSLDGMVFCGRLLSASSEGNRSIKHTSPTKNPLEPLHTCAISPILATKSRAEVGRGSQGSPTTPKSPAVLKYLANRYALSNNGKIAFGKHETAGTQNIRTDLSCPADDPFPSCNNPEVHSRARKRLPKPSFMYPSANTAGKKSQKEVKCASCCGPLSLPRESKDARAPMVMACGRHMYCGRCIQELETHDVRQPLLCCLPCYAESNGKWTFGPPLKDDDDRLLQAAAELHDQAALLYTTVTRYVVRTGCGWGENLPTHLQHRIDEAFVKLLVAEKKRYTSAVEYLLARILCQAGSPNRDFHRGIHYCKLASSAEHPGAMCLLGKIFAGTDMVKACRWYAAAAHAGNREAQFLLGISLLGEFRGSTASRGEFLRGGNPVALDPGRAIALLTLAAEPTEDGIVHAGAANVLGLMCLQAPLLPAPGVMAGAANADVQRAAAVRWFQLSAEGGSAEGQYNLGHFLFSDGKHGGDIGCRRDVGHIPSESMKDTSAKGCTLASNKHNKEENRKKETNPDPSGSWRRSPHGNSGWSPLSQNYPNTPISGKRDPASNWRDVANFKSPQESRISINGGTDEGCSVHSIKWFARAAAQGHSLAQFELDRWLPAVATSLDDISPGDHVFLSGFILEETEHLNGEVAIIGDLGLSPDGTPCATVSLLGYASETDTKETYTAVPGNIRPLRC